MNFDTLKVLITFIEHLVHILRRLLAILVYLLIMQLDDYYYDYYNSIFLNILFLFYLLIRNI
jgi:hypothetical protein